MANRNFAGHAYLKSCIIQSHSTMVCLQTTLKKVRGVISISDPVFNISLLLVRARFAAYGANCESVPVRSCTNCQAFSSRWRWM